MNSFQSLLNSYSKLRKRTYEFTRFDEAQEIGSTSKVRQIPDGIRQEIVSQFQKLGNYKSDVENLKDGFNKPVDFEMKDDNTFVWRAKDKPNFSFQASQSKGFGSLPESYLPHILTFLETGGQTHTDAAGTALQTDTEAEVYQATPNEMAGARNIQRLNTKLERLIGSKAGLNFEKGDVFATLSSMQIYSKDNPNYHPTSQFQLLMQSMINSGADEEELQEAILELQEDTIDLLDYFDSNREQLDRALASKGMKNADGTSAEECVPSSPELEKLRERFFISQLKPGGRRCLTYGNLEGEATSPSKMSQIMNRSKEAGDVANQDSWAKSGTGKERPGRIASEQLASDPNNGISISAQTNTNKGQESSSFLMQEVDKYKDVKICTPEGEEDRPLFAVHAPEAATQLTSLISEKTSVIANLMHRIQHADLNGEDRKILKKRLAQEIESLIDAALRDTEMLNELVKLVKMYEKQFGGPPPGLPLAVKELENTFDKLGSANPNFKDFETAKRTILAMLSRELNSPVQKDLQDMVESGDMEGTVTVTDRHPDGRTVNQITGVKNAHEGVYDVDYPTRCVADNLILFTSRNDVLAFFERRGINPNSRGAKLALDNPHCCPPQYIVPTSDKFYQESGPTSQGKVAWDKALNNTEYVVSVVENIFEDDPDLEGIKEDVIAERDAHQAHHKAAFIQLGDPKLTPPNPTPDEIDATKNTELNVIEEFLEAELGLAKENSRDSIEIQKLQREIKEFQEDYGDDMDSPQAISQKSNLAHKLADLRRKAARRGMSKTRRQASLAADYILKNLASTGSSNAILNIKSFDTGEASNITEDDIRLLIKVRALETRNGENIHSRDIDRAIKAANRRTSKKSGTTEVAATTTIHSKRIIELLETLKNQA
jgi:hypothetical protein